MKLVEFNNCGRGKQVLRSSISLALEICYIICCSWQCIAAFGFAAVAAVLLLLLLSWTMAMITMAAHMLLIVACGTPTCLQHAMPCSALHAVPPATCHMPPAACHMPLEHIVFAIWSVWRFLLLCVQLICRTAPQLWLPSLICATNHRCINHVAARQTSDIAAKSPVNVRQWHLPI